MVIPLFDPVDFRNYIAENGSEDCKEQVNQMTNDDVIEFVSASIDWDRINALVSKSFVTAMYHLEGLNPPDQTF